MKVAIKLKGNIITGHIWLYDEDYSNVEYDKIINLASTKDIIPYKSRLINDVIDNSFDYDEDYLVKKKIKEDKKAMRMLREKREILLEAFDKWEKAVLRGRADEDENIMTWYKNLLDLKQEAFLIIPDAIKYYLSKAFLKELEVNQNGS